MLSDMVARKTDGCVSQAGAYAASKMLANELMDLISNFVSRREVEWTSNGKQGSSLVRSQR